MSDIVIKVENIGKQYRLGQVGTGTVSHDLNRWWHKVRGKEDPYLKIGEANDRSKKGTGNLVWALKDINFEVKQGEVLGIIGKNGAGKSTLLKILSRVTGPTTGDIKVKGRIASLLEVGTGFHPELTGRENIFLNGAILGMSKQEIKSKFDEIVNFSGVERYIDTPVKRYSSGMYVRLAFAVAAHLEPEILIVDEVLAVGDADFQEKCLGKMKDVSGQGRTVLFVSHNLGSVSELCTKGILLENGALSAMSDIDQVISIYRNKYRENKYVVSADSNKELYFTKLEIESKSDNKKIVTIFGEFKTNGNIRNASIGVLVTDTWGQKISTILNSLDLSSKTGIVKFKLEIDLSLFRNGKYYFDFALFIPKSITYDYVKEGLSVEFEENEKLLISVFDKTNIGSLHLDGLWQVD